MSVKNMRYTRTAALLLFLSFALITTGLTLIWIPLGWIAGGAFLGLLAYAYHVAAKEEKP